MVLAACGKGGGGAASQPAAGNTAATKAVGAALPDACELMTADDVQAVTREVSGSLSSTLEDAVGKDPSQCSYGLGGDVPPKVISLSARRAPGTEQAASQQETAESGLRSIATGAPVEDLPRLGDGAFWVGGRIDQLHVRYRDTLLIFTVQLEQDPLRAARTLASQALVRLARPAGPARPTQPENAAPPATGAPDTTAPPRRPGGSS
ncbi:MAG TPA: hypothetical protein VKY89_05050 [Thermoanaerobaculia bacterium]|nr:hypothetical protein [Thermoanaerobaculia bacterium]